MQTVLLIEDDIAVAEPLIFSLRTEGLAVRHVTLLSEAREALREKTVGLLVLDVGLPDGSGFDFCREIRKQGDLPILMLTARGEAVDRIVGLEIGADDYVTKPFSPREVSLRVRKLLARQSSGSTQNAPPVFEHDAAAQRVRYCGQTLELTRLEYHLLCALLRRPGAIQTRESLLAAAWERDSDAADRTIDTHVKTLRAKLKAVRVGEDPIVTHRGLGYSVRALD